MVSEREERAFFSKELDINIMEEFRELKSCSELPVNKLADREELTRHINRSSKNAIRAKKIFLMALHNSR